MEKTESWLSRHSKKILIFGAALVAAAPPVVIGLEKSVDAQYQQELGKQHRPEYSINRYNADQQVMLECTCTLGGEALIAFALAMRRSQAKPE